MKIIIHLASHDDDAVLNYATYMRVVGSEIGVSELHSKLTFTDGKLTDRANLLSKISINDRDTNEIYLMAHGTLSHSNFIILKKPGPTSDIIEPDDIRITPDDVNKYFRENGVVAEEFKFHKVTIIACCSDNFGKLLSDLMKTVKIACFNEPVSVRYDGKFHANSTKELVEPKIFLNGNPYIPSSNESTEEKKINEPRSEMSILEEFDPLYQRPLMIRDNPYERYNDQSLSHPTASDPSNPKVNLESEKENEIDNDNDDRPSSPKP